MASELTKSPALISPEPELRAGRSAAGGRTVCLGPLCFGLRFRWCSWLRSLSVVCAALLWVAQDGIGTIQTCHRELCGRVAVIRMEQAGQCAVGRSNDSRVCQGVNLQDAVVIGVRRRGIQFVFPLDKYAAPQNPPYGGTEGRSRD